MNLDTVLTVVFLVLLGFFLYIRRRKIVLQKILFPLLYLVMYKTKRGLKSMDWVASKFGKPLKYLGYLVVFVGFAGMILLMYQLFLTLYNLIAAPEAPSGVGVVLPIQVKGVFYVPFIYFIISIFTLAVLHEFSHGVFARRAGVKLKSAGFAVLGILIPVIPAAFVEPNEKQLQKKKKSEQLAVFAAGPFANIAAALLLAVLAAYLFFPMVAGINSPDGMVITDFSNESAAKNAGISAGEKIIQIENSEIKSYSDLVNATKELKPRQKITIETDKGSYELTLGSNPLNKSLPYMGVFIEQETRIKPGYSENFNTFVNKPLIWFAGNPFKLDMYHRMGLLGWLILLNFGIGLFNLVPMGPVDGGRMLKVVLDRFFKKERAEMLWKNISTIVLALVLVIVVFGFLK